MVVALGDVVGKQRIDAKVIAWLSHSCQEAQLHSVAVAGECMESEHVPAGGPARARGCQGRRRSAVPPGGTCRVGRRRRLPGRPLWGRRWRWLLAAGAGAQCPSCEPLLLFRSHCRFAALHSSRHKTYFPSRKAPGDVAQSLALTEVVMGSDKTK